MRTPSPDPPPGPGLLPLLSPTPGTSSLPHPPHWAPLLWAFHAPAFLPGILPPGPHSWIPLSVPVCRHGGPRPYVLVWFALQEPVGLHGESRFAFLTGLERPDPVRARRVGRARAEEASPALPEVTSPDRIGVCLSQLFEVGKF